MSVEIVPVEQLRELLAKATPGPYRREGRADIWADAVAIEGDDGWGVEAERVAECHSPFEADLFCAAVNALPGLLDDRATSAARIAALEAEIAALKGRVNEVEQAGALLAALAEKDLSPGTIRGRPAAVDAALRVFRPIIRATPPSRKAPAMSEAPVEQIAAGLTEAQLEALRSAKVREPHPVLPDYWSVEIPGWNLTALEAEELVALQLVKLPIRRGSRSHTDSYHGEILPLGRALRTHLEEKA